MRNKLLNFIGSNRKLGQITAEGNVIYIYDFIAGSKEEARYWGGVSAEDFVALIAEMSGEVHVRIDSPGGDVFGGRAIAQAIREHDGKVIAHIDGLAASAASYIAIAADEVIAAPGAFMMVHKSASFAFGNADDFTGTAELLSKIDHSIAASYAAKSDEGVDFWLEKMAAETWLSGDEALALGLVDKVIDEAAAKAVSDWDLSAFDNAPAPSAKKPDAAAQAAAQAETDKAALTAAEEIAARQRDLAVSLLLTPA